MVESIEFAWLIVHLRGSSNKANTLLRLFLDTVGHCVPRIVTSDCGFQNTQVERTCDYYLRLNTQRGSSVTGTRVMFKTSGWRDDVMERS